MFYGLDLKLSEVFELANNLGHYHWTGEDVKKLANSNLTLIKEFVLSRSQIISNEELLLKVKKTLSRKMRQKVRLGIGIKNAEGFEAALRKVGFEITDRASEIFRHSNFKVSSKDIEIEVISVYPDDFGPGEVLDYKEKSCGFWNVINRARKFGLDFVPSETAPQFLLQHEKLLPDTSIAFATNPMYSYEDSEGYSSALCFESYKGIKNSFQGKRVLGTNPAFDSGSSGWSNDTPWIFRVINPKKFEIQQP